MRRRSHTKSPQGKKHSKGKTKTRRFTSGNAKRYRAAPHHHSTYRSSSSDAIAVDNIEITVQKDDGKLNPSLFVQGSKINNVEMISKPKFGVINTKLMVWFPDVPGIEDELDQVRQHVRGIAPLHTGYQSPQSIRAKKTQSKLKPSSFRPGQIQTKSWGPIHKKMYGRVGTDYEMIVPQQRTRELKDFLTVFMQRVNQDIKETPLLSAAGEPILNALGQPVFPRVFSASPEPLAIIKNGNELSIQFFCEFDIGLGIGLFGGGGDGDGGGGDGAGGDSDGVVYL